LLAGKVVAVTGAGRGVGREVALLCARYGAMVVVNDPGVGGGGEGGDTGLAQQVVDEIAGAGGNAFANIASVADAAGAQSIVEDAVREFGQIDAVVNNAGILRDAMWHKMSHDDWRAVIDVNLNGPFNVSKAATPYFREQGSGSFIHFTSNSGLVGNLGQANYSAAKLGLVALSQSIALDMARVGVRSNCIAPFAWSRMTASIPTDTPEQQQRVERMKSMSADKIAPLVVYLASDTSKDVTNQIFAVRKNEIVLFGKSRPLRSMAKLTGWTPEAISEELIPSFRPSFARADEVSAHVFPYDPI
jgi:NAD(P)-dependent dehydrogenase (short-subunit alcohol dehydrogenase family)